VGFGERGKVFVISPGWNECSPDSQRIYEALMPPNDGSFSNPFPVRTMMKPYGVDGAWKTYAEYVSL
jgi:hypothetical protein